MLARARGDMRLYMDQAVGTNSTQSSCRIVILVQPLALILSFCNVPLLLMP